MHMNESMIISVEQSRHIYKNATSLNFATSTKRTQGD
ncbi:unnamed protein product [Chondrus crispus]|uniref:Uncharacterized protein n=1 Tax=Chondrus crispus TaxID=2769 RepID=R7QD88_CHOCR|nr:unnamed protein product [Chondrus crispus]CDF36014.1 unnamed protein product [Chondrus crispus]|eukprot:XP_005715833.1 unnamed protein product [Chondrus crispus]